MTELSMTPKYQRQPHVTEQQVGDERMLMDEKADNVHVLNGSAAFIWDCLKKPATLSDIEALLRKEFDMSAVPNVGEIIERTLKQLQEKGLVKALPAEG